jgi:hypothetical protein
VNSNVIIPSGYLIAGQELAKRRHPHQSPIGTADGVFLYLYEHHRDLTIIKYPYKSHAGYGSYNIQKTTVLLEIRDTVSPWAIADDKAFLQGQSPPLCSLPKLNAFIDETEITLVLHRQSAPITQFAYALDDPQLFDYLDAHIQQLRESTSCKLADTPPVWFFIGIILFIIGCCLASFFIGMSLDSLI